MATPISKGYSNMVKHMCLRLSSITIVNLLLIGAQSNVYNGKSRHIRHRHNTIRQLLSSDIVAIDYVRSKNNIADPLTKGLPES